MSNKLIYKSTDPIYTEEFVWNQQGKPYTILLHSISMSDSTFTAYARTFDYLLTFPLGMSDKDYLQNIMGSYSFSPKNCLICHTNK